LVRDERYARACRLRPERDPYGDGPVRRQASCRGRVLFDGCRKGVDDHLITEEELDKYRLEGTKVRIVRDALEMNDVVGYVVAWDDKSMLIRRPNRRVVKLRRDYAIAPASEPRAVLLTNFAEEALSEDEDA